MRDGRKTTSIARRIAWRYRRQKLFGILVQTALLGAAGLFCWCAALARQLQGSLFPLGYVEIWGGVIDLSRDTVSEALAGGSPYLRCAAFYTADGQLAYIGDFLFWLCFVLAAYLSVRLFLWLIASLGATGRIRRYLRPIDDIALVTESISSHGLDESKFHSLEEAIDHLNGVSADEKLHVGDDDLAGLETAVNNLIVRMHNTYRSQVRFVDDASHELRTPIAVIGGYADMLDRWGKNDPQVLDESIRAIRTETEHMKTLVEQLLFLARGDAGRTALDIRPVDIGALVGEVWEESRMIDPAHEYILRAEDGVKAPADEAMLKQAVRILVENAAKYSPEHSRVTLRAYMDGSTVRIDVQDNGMGMRPEDAERMFDRFYRADRARNSGTGGSGLGLSIARWIVGRHGGSFEVKTYEDIGTRVTILLPGRMSGYTIPRRELPNKQGVA